MTVRPRWRAIAAGERVGRLVVTCSRQPGDTHVECQCDCGSVHIVKAGNWGHTQSCGCLRREATRASGLVHGGHNRCTDPLHERVTDPDRPDRTNCRTCEQVRARRVNRKLREGVLAAYGRACACCGETHEVFLTLDHVDSSGAAHRRELSNGHNSGNAHVYRWLRDNGYPPGYRLLCFNCNSGRHINGGQCPHEVERSKSGRPGSTV